MNPDKRGIRRRRRKGDAGTSTTATRGGQARNLVGARGKRKRREGAGAGAEAGKNRAEQDTKT